MRALSSRARQQPLDGDQTAKASWVTSSTKHLFLVAPLNIPACNTSIGHPQQNPSLILIARMVLVSGHRPWLSLYNNLVTVPNKEIPESEQVELAPIQRALPNEMLVKIFSQLDPYSLGKAALVRDSRGKGPSLRPPPHLTTHLQPTPPQQPPHLTP